MPVPVTPGPVSPGAARPQVPGAGGAAGAAGRSPLPGSLSGGPPGPGASPITSVGAGAGNEAMADSVIKAIIPALHKALSSYQIGSKKYNSVINALRALTSNFGKENQESMVPAALLQLQQQARSGARPPQAPPPQIQPRPISAGLPRPSTAGMGAGAETAEM